MDFLSIVLTVLFALSLFHGLTILSRKSKRLPPGPTPLPIIGNLNLLGDQPHRSLAKLAQIHGPIMSLKLGQVNAVVFSSSAMAKEVLQKQDLAFSSRSIPDAVRARDHGKLSVVFLPVAARWRSLRKIMNSNIFSVNKLDVNQHLRFKKVEELIEYCQKMSENGEALDVGRAAFRTSLNLLSNTFFSKDLTDPFSDSAKEFKELISNIMVEAGRPNLVDYFPVFQKIDPQSVRRRMEIHFSKVLKLFGDLINERLDERELRGIVKNDVLDVLLTTSKEFPEEIDRPHMEHLCLDLFVAGTDTTSSTLEWSMTELLSNPESMKKAKEELGQVIGRGKIITEADIPNLPYLMCIIKETLRLHPSVPFLIPRKVEQDVEVLGYIVPKGSQVLVNVWAIGRDPNEWEDPLAFKPERYWKTEIDVKGRDFDLIPFGAGRRICPGLSLAMRMVPLMLGSMLNSFHWKLEDGVTPDQLDMAERFGITVMKAQPLIAMPISLS